MGDPKLGYSMTMAPLVVKGKVLVGNSGGEFGVRGWLTALDAATGSIAWRAYHSGPDRDVLIGPNFRPFYGSDSGADLGVKTWPPDAWTTGGGTVWGWISYDPALDLIFYGTGNPGPWNPEQRPGDNKWTSSVLARRPGDGALVWADGYGDVPGDPAEVLTQLSEGDVSIDEFPWLATNDDGWVSYDLGLFEADTVDLMLDVGACGLEPTTILDLTGPRPLLVREGRVWLKTLEGLQRVHAILRRQDDAYCDPLELRGWSVAVAAPDGR